MSLRQAIERTARPSRRAEVCEVCDDPEQRCVRHRLLRPSLPQRGERP